MAFPLVTDTFDITSRGLPCDWIIGSTTFISTAGLDVTFRGLPALGYQTLTSGGGGGSQPTPTTNYGFLPVIEGWIGQGKSRVYIQ